MAKIFSTEKLSINEDSIRIKSSTDGAFEITDANDSVLISRSTIESDIGSLNTQDSVNLSSLDSSIASLETVESTNVSSLDSQVGSLDTQDSVNLSSLDSSIASLSADISTNDVYANNITSTDGMESGVSSITINYSSAGFTSEPAVVGTLRSTGANDPIIGVQLSGAPSTTSATFVFSDSIPSDNYTFDVLASI